MLKLRNSVFTDIMPCATVSPDVEARYTEVIDSILAKSDLNTISEKRIRKGLQEVVGYDLTPQKVRTPSSALSQIVPLDIGPSWALHNFR